MRYEIHKNSIVVSKSLQGVIDNKINKVSSRIKRDQLDSSHLSMRLLHNPKDNSYECNLHLKAFTENFFSKKSAGDLRSAIDKSFDAIISEVSRYSDKISRARSSAGAEHKEVVAG